MSTPSLDSPYAVRSKQMGASRWDLILVRETQGPGPEAKALSLFYIRAVRWKTRSTDPRTGIQYVLRDVVFERTEGGGARLLFWGTPEEKIELSKPPMGLRLLGRVDPLAHEIARKPAKQPRVSDAP